MSTQNEQHARRQVFQAAGLVATAVLISRIIGLVRDMVTKNYLGALTLDATAYDAANRLPETIFFVIAGGAIGSAFIPTFTGYFTRDDEAGAWRLFSAVINLLTITVAVIAGVAIIFAPQYVNFFMADLVADNPELLDLTVELMRIMLFSTIIFAASGVIMGALNARQHFLLPALAPIIYNLGIIAGAVTFAAMGKEPVIGLAVGTVAGAMGHLLIQLPGLRQKRAQYTAVFTIRDKGVQQVLRLMGPRVLGLSFSELNYFIILYLTDSMAIGSYVAVIMASRLMRLPLGIIGQAMGIAAFPTMAALAAKGAFDEMRQILSDSLRLLLFFGLPSVVWLALLATPLITLLYERGEFGADDTAMVAPVLTLLAFSIPALMTLEIVNRAFYSLNDTITPVAIGLAQMLLMWLFSYGLATAVFPYFNWPPVNGLSLAFTLSNYVEAGLLLWLLRGKMGGINGRLLFDGAWRMGAAAAAMAVAVILTQLQLTTLSPLFQLLIAGTIGGLTYLIAAYILRVTELNQFINLIKRRLPR